MNHRTWTPLTPGGQRDVEDGTAGAGLPPQKPQGVKWEGETPRCVLKRNPDEEAGVSHELDRTRTTLSVGRRLLPGDPFGGA